MAELHELLAVDRDLEQQLTDAQKQIASIFDQRHSFESTQKTLHMFDDARSNEEAAQEENQYMSARVDSELVAFEGKAIAHLDAFVQKESANTAAKADLKLDDGTVLLQNMPATVLLGLEGKLAKLKVIYERIPVLDTSLRWEEDKTVGHNVWRVEEDILKHKTEKTVKHKVLYEATKEHPAQIREWSEDVPVGQYRTVRHSAMWPLYRKLEVIDRITGLIESVKKARMRANKQEIPDILIGKKLFAYINDE
uniref:Uncharacterized protein n=1 Tax=viral metagenome TaxID=1070528 RepID=A0A6M3L5K4_9ZZZZ